MTTPDPPAAPATEHLEELKDQDLAGWAYQFAGAMSGDVPFDLVPLLDALSALTKGQTWVVRWPAQPQRVEREATQQAAGLTVWPTTRPDYDRIASAVSICGSIDAAVAWIEEEGRRDLRPAPAASPTT